MTISTTLDVRTLPLDQLTPAPYNPRKVLRPTAPAYQKLEASLRNFGLVEPLIWNATTGHVVGGHARLRILRSLGVTDVPVSVVHLTPARERALNVVLNNREAQGQFDPAALAALLTELADLPELPLTGFDAGTLADLQLQPTAAAPTDTTAGVVEIALVTDDATFARLTTALDDLVRTFALTCHVQRR
jgi:hypothetical protein